MRRIDSVVCILAVAASPSGHAAQAVDGFGFARGAPPGRAELEIAEDVWRQVRTEIGLAGK